MLDCDICKQCQNCKCQLSSCQECGGCLLVAWQSQPSAMCQHHLCLGQLGCWLVAPLSRDDVDGLMGE